MPGTHLMKSIDTRAASRVGRPVALRFAAEPRPDSPQSATERSRHLLLRRIWASPLSRSHRLNHLRGSRLIPCIKPEDIAANDSNYITSDHIRMELGLLLMIPARGA